ncbi:PREDICTED: uncharacterized protein LOC109582636 [Amphimedon queenslandica]|uniref:HECT-type E3 ubiquitin transferase n=1 Tax=Amphimedon queenslandica TaxID=400682 RepID=A0AAN0J8K1_AMPQE|nr:PREDICTED: uncharacterized protein LOC109582636 [Amphimedon queenslandica]|eukprot:XP_019853033.1 PREDICTED: uncharacterized protein LOC109582636 [Amphimedon queenslandica]
MSGIRELVAAQEQLERAVDKLKSSPEAQPSASSGSGSSLGSGSHPGSIPSTSRGINRDINTPTHNIWNPMSIINGERRAGHSSKQLKPPAKKKAKVPSWTHNFVCLARVEQDIVPDSSERAVLQIAGLGEKKIQFPVDADSYYVYDELIASFPKLRNCGGFELLRTHDRSKLLIEIEVPPSGYTVAYLKPVVHNAKIFIRPLQKDLSLEPEKDDWELPCSVEEECMFCKEKISINVLRKHLENCKERGTNTDTISPDPPLNLEIATNDGHEDKGGTSFEEEIVCLDDDYADSLLVPYLTNDETIDIKTIEDVAKSLNKFVCDFDEFDMVIRRSAVLTDALRRMDKASFDPAKKLNVVFVGEEGSDLGGLTREFFRLLSHDISSYIDCTGCFTHDSLAFQNNIYLKLGILAGMALCQGAGSFPVLCPSVYKFMCGTNPTDLAPTIDEVSDLDKRTLLQQIMECDEIVKLHNLLSSNLELLLDSGFNKPVTNVKLCDKEQILKAITLHSVILTVAAELSQF